MTRGAAVAAVSLALSKSGGRRSACDGRWRRLAAVAPTEAGPTPQVENASEAGFDARPWLAFVLWELIGDRQRARSQSASDRRAVLLPLGIIAGSSVSLRRDGDRREMEAWMTRGAADAAVPRCPPRCDGGDARRCTDRSGRRGRDAKGGL